MNFKLFFFIFVIGIALTAASPYRTVKVYKHMTSMREPIKHCWDVGSCIYEHATCGTGIILENAGCIHRRKCCVTDFYNQD